VAFVSAVMLIDVLPTLPCSAVYGSFEAAEIARPTWPDNPEPICSQGVAALCCLAATLACLVAPVAWGLAWVVALAR